MSVKNEEIETYFGRCRCCLSYGYLKNMWSEHKFEGETIIYGEMLVQCFALSWESPEDMEQDQICERCIHRLRDASDFKKVVLDSQEELLQQIDAENIATFKEEPVDEEYLVYKDPKSEPDTMDTEYTIDAAESAESTRDEAEYEEIEFLEEEDAGDANEVVVTDSSLPVDQPKRRKRPVQSTQPDTEEGITKRKWPKKLPKAERYKSYKQYTEEDMRKCMEAIRKGELTPNEAAVKYNIPKKTISSKMKIEPKDVLIDNTTKSTNKYKLELCKKKLRKKPTIFGKKADIDAKTKKTIERNKLKARYIKNRKNKTVKADTDKDIDKITIDVNINPKYEEIETVEPVNADQVRTRYKALVNEKFKKETNEIDKSDVAEMIKHRDNIKTILTYSNATLIKGFWGVGYSCCFCEEQREIPSELKKHNFETHSNVGDEAIKVKYVSDLVIRLDITDLKCKLCEETIDTLEDIMEHLSKMHSKLMHNDIKNHIIPFKFDGNTLKCLKCKREFKYFKLLSEHMSEHYRNYECSVCDRAFINKQSMQTHSYRHRKGVFKCTHCPKVFDSRPKRSVHERVVHALSNKTRKCAFCDERFSTKDLVQSHEVKVHGVKPTVFSCQACNKSYNSQSSLITHRNRFHLMLRPHKCSYCEMAFFSKIELRSHTVTHTKSRDFKCEMCSKSFGTRCSLNQHVRGHLDDRRYKCENCDRAFVHRTAWKVHMRSKHGKIV